MYKYNTGKNIFKHVKTKKYDFLFLLIKKHTFHFAGCVSNADRKVEQMRQLPEFMMLTGLETRDFEAAEREDLHRLISTLLIENVNCLKCCVK